MKVILGVVIVFMGGYGTAHAQQGSIALNCSGTNDTSELNRVISSFGSESRTLKLPAQNVARCAVSQTTIPANITIDNTDGAGLTVNTGGTLTILGDIINPAGKQIFFNALAGQGTVSFKGNRYLSVLNPEWWGAKTTKDDSPALNACSTAAATLTAADIDLVNTYNLASTWQVGVGVPFTYITLRGHGAGSNGTTLNWVGATDGLMVKFWANKYSNIDRIRFQNGVSFGRTVGLRFSGPGTGTQSNNFNIDNCIFTGFYFGLQAGDPTTQAASSELSFRNVAFDGNANGFVGLSTGNTLVITFLNCSFANNKISGLHLGSASDCHIFGGGFGANGTDITATGWTSTLSVIGARFEMVNPDVALTIGGVGTVAVRNCTFMSEPNQMPTHAIIRGETNLTLENNFVGREGESWIFYDYGTGGSGKNYQFVATSNIVRGKVLYMHPDNNAIDGLATLIEGVKGEIVWPNLVTDAVAGQGQMSRGALRVKLTRRRNTNYSISLASDADERLHFANKTVEGFDIVSSDRTSNSNVTWSVAKN
ncbi:MAG: Flagellar hook-length control protein FliK [Acidobacteria bacterium]|nr:Flagellar hook-length control protein FliK [Acidobacteriota bacterium]